MSRRDAWILQNVSSKHISLSDLNDVPSLPPGWSVDLLRYCSKDDALASRSVFSVVKNGWCTLTKVEASGETVVNDGNANTALTPATKDTVGGASNPMTEDFDLDGNSIFMRGGDIDMGDGLVTPPSGGGNLNMNGGTIMNAPVILPGDSTISLQMGHAVGNGASLRLFGNSDANSIPALRGSAQIMMDTRLGKTPKLRLITDDGTTSDVFAVRHTGAVEFLNGVIHQNNLDQRMFSTSSNVFYLYSGTGGLRVNKQDNSDWIAEIDNAGNATVKGSLSVLGQISTSTLTPTGTADAAGVTGQITWNASYIYVKTGAGWKRAALSTF